MCCFLPLCKGGSYEGSFAFGKFSGQGVYTFPSTSIYRRYEGFFDEGAMHGKGVISFRDGGAIDGKLHDGRVRGEAIATCVCACRIPQC